ncbi:TPA: hypothetical protein N0F65_007340 [Lagenidium giganteum]|uniref:Uncharacterized protein n=1 Tax=Lagenidium giganteum TaxID=4803 RepID=A0AAV2Z823_9STRA|nr:TPA: hypothetical protein N0F65_007340 [Lagenidium giganteum]
MDVEYIAETSESDQDVGKALVGWENPKCMVSPPRGVMGRVNRKFAKLLLQHHFYCLPKLAFVDVLAAVLLLYYRQTHQCMLSNVLDRLLQIEESIRGLASPEQIAAARDHLNRKAMASKSHVVSEYLFLFEDMQSIPTGNENHAQRDAVLAMGIAYQHMGARTPQPYSTARTARQQAKWRADVQAWAQQLQVEVLDRIHASSTNTRKRKRTVAVSGVLQAWPKLPAMTTIIAQNK